MPLAIYVPEVEPPHDLKGLCAYLKARVSVDNVCAVREAVLIAHGKYMVGLVEARGRKGAVLHVVRKMRDTGTRVTLSDAFWERVVALDADTAKKLNAYANELIHGGARVA